jgi:hypothetical protein
VKNEKIPPKENWKQNCWFNSIDLRNFSVLICVNLFSLRRGGLGQSSLICIP